MLYGSMFSTLTFRFFRYFSSILYGCLALLVRSSIITSTGPFVLSGFAAGVSVDGPMASVSARFKAGGGASFAGDEEAPGASSGVLGSTSCAVGAAIGAAAGASVVCVGVSAGAGPAPDASKVLISTELAGRGSLLLCGRDTEAVGCGVFCGAVEAGSAGDDMVGWPTSLALQSGDGSDCRQLKRMEDGRTSWQRFAEQPRRRRQQQGSEE
jgi:hypothetical protein